jgi:hypothetical protein
MVTGPITVSNFASSSALMMASVSVEPARSMESRIMVMTM